MKIEKSHLVKETTGGVSVRRSLNFSEGAEFPTYRLPLQCWLSGGMCCPGQHVHHGVSPIKQPSEGFVLKLHLSLECVQVL